MNIAQLDMELEKIFCCIDGAAKAFFEFPVYTKGEWSVFRVVYKTISVNMLGESDQVGPILCQWGLVKIAGLLTEEQREDHSVVLFWRTRPCLVEFLDPQGKRATNLWMRLMIPGVPEIPFARKTENDPAMWL